MEIIRRDINEQEEDDGNNNSGEDNDNDENKVEYGEEDEADDENTEAKDEDDNRQSRTCRQGSPVARQEPHGKKHLQKHLDMKETEQLHFQLSFVSSEAS